MTNKTEGQDLYKAMKECLHLLKPKHLPPQKNALRVEIGWPVCRCALLPKKDQFGREYDTALYVLSGGDPIDCAAPCVGGLSDRCPIHKAKINSMGIERN